MNANQAPSVYVVLLNWNNARDTSACVDALGIATYQNLHLMIVDNGSADGSGALLEAKYPHAEVIFNQSNVGFARGCNVGIKRALQDPNCEFVLLLNNDCVPSPDFLEPAVAVAMANPEVGLVGGKLLLTEDPPVIWYAGGTVNRWRGQPAVRGFREADTGKYDTIDEVGFITGAMMLIKRQVVESVGPLPEEYFFGTEEYDYSMMVRKAGYRLLYVPAFSAVHHCGSSRALHDEDLKFTYLGYRQRFIFQDKYLPPGVSAMLRHTMKGYGVLFAARKWQREQEKGHPENPEIDVDGMKFALNEAIRDHGMNALDESALDAFMRRYQVHRAKAAR